MTVKAISRLSTTLLVEKRNNSWVLQISASLTAFHMRFELILQNTDQNSESFQTKCIGTYQKQSPD